jgi:formate hydrogenlyase subunit 6/NADH:ubiquinone oxidoreductase subunit I
MTRLISQKMGIHAWRYDNAISVDRRLRVPLRDISAALKNIRIEVELGFDPQLAFKEAQRCLNCDVQTVFTPKLCIECDACMDICPMDSISFTANGEEDELRPRLRAPALNLSQDLYVSETLKTGRVMVKDEDVCLHCGLCAERCPTGAWDMQKFLLEMTHAGAGCRSAGTQTSQQALKERECRRSKRSMISSSSSPTSTARGRHRRTSFSRAPSCAWACRSRHATSFRRTSRGCRPGSKCASPSTAISVAAAAST